LERTRAALKATNDESAGRRKKLEALEADEAKRKQAEMTETERLKAAAADEKVKREAAEEALKTERTRGAVLTAAAKANLADPEDAWRMIDQATLTVGADGAVTGADKAVEALAKAKPYLVKQVTGGGGIPPTPKPGAPSATEVNEELIKKKRQDAAYHSI